MEDECRILRPVRSLTLMVGPASCVYRDVAELGGWGLRVKEAPDLRLVGEGVQLGFRYGDERDGRGRAFSFSVSRFGGFYLDSGIRRTGHGHRPPGLSHRSLPYTQDSVCPLSFLALEGDLTNGLKIGLARTHQSSLGTLPGKNLALGWLTELHVSARYNVGDRADLALTHTWADQGGYSLADFYLLTRSGLGLSLTYRPGR